MTARRWTVRLACACTVTVTTGMTDTEFEQRVPAKLRCATHRWQSVVDVRPLELGAIEQHVAEQLLTEHREKGTA